MISNTTLVYLLSSLANPWLLAVIRLAKNDINRDHCSCLACRALVDVLAEMKCFDGEVHLLLERSCQTSRVTGRSRKSTARLDRALVASILTSLTTIYGVWKDRSDFVSPRDAGTFNDLWSSIHGVRRCLRGEEMQLHVLIMR